MEDIEAGGGVLVSEWKAWGGVRMCECICEHISDSKEKRKVRGTENSRNPSYGKQQETFFSGSVFLFGGGVSFIQRKPPLPWGMVKGSRRLIRATMAANHLPTCSHVAGETDVAGNGLAVPASWTSQANVPLALDFHPLTLLEEASL